MLQILQVLFYCSGLWPNLANVLPSRGFGIDHGQSLHHFLGSLGGSIAAHGKNHEDVHKPECSL